MDHVYWLLEVEIRSGREADFKDLMEEMVTATQASEPGTMNYEWNTSSDGKVCHIYERYQDSAAVMTHLGNFGSKFAERFMDILTPVRFMVYGSPNDEVKEALDDFNPLFLEPAGGFHR